MKTGFAKDFQNWVSSFCKKYNYPEPADSYYLKIFERIPEGVQKLINEGIKEKIIITKDHLFTLKGIAPQKGPYNWFSRSAKKEPTPNWEYFIQVAEYVRFYPLARQKGLRIGFEEGLMDIALFRGDCLFACIEVKEKSKDVSRLIQGIKKYQNLHPLPKIDRGNDPLRKAKYIIKHKPEYFCILAIGSRMEFKVMYPTQKTFSLKKDLLPI